MKLLYIISSYNIYGGTPKKTLDLLSFFKNDAVLYVYSNSYSEFKPLFEATGAKVYEGYYGKNYLKHLTKLLKIIKDNNIEIVQTQFSMGETLGFLIKSFRPKVKVICAFVGPFKPSYVKSLLLSHFYRKFDVFVYISNYVKTIKEKQFSILKKNKSVIIFNGSKMRRDTGESIPKMIKYSLLDVAGLLDWKNIKVLIEALNILINKRNNKNLNLYVAGDGPEKQNLKGLIADYNLANHVNLMGYQKNIGGLLNSCDIFVHPAYSEGFGIVIPEAMLAQKPIIVSNAGALPELIENEVEGLVVEPHDAKEWADAIMKYIKNIEFANSMASNAKKRAKNDFSVIDFTLNYKKLYMSLLNNKN